MVSVDVLVFTVFLGAGGLALLRALWSVYHRVKLHVTVGSLFPSKGNETISFLFGNMTDIVKDRDRVLEEMLVDHIRKMSVNPIAISNYILGKLIATITLFHPEAVAAVMSRQSGKGYSYYIVREWLGDGLLLSEGSKWHKHRKLLTPAFHFDILKTYFPTYHSVADVLLTKLDRYAESGDTWAVGDDMSSCTLDVLMECIFGRETNFRSGSWNEYAKAMVRLPILSTKRVLLNPLISQTFAYRFTKEGREYYSLCDAVHRISDRVIKDRRQDQLVNQTDRHRYDFLELILNAKDENGQGLTDLEIRHEVDTFMFEGHDTTSAGLSWIIHNLARYPDYQEEVYQEIVDILGVRHPDGSDLPKLQKLSLFIKESLRLFPPVPVVERKLGVDVEVDGKIIPNGATVAIPAFAIHRNKAVWGEDADEFKPERFSDGNSGLKALENPYSYIPFAAGPRNCIGQNFAMHEMKVLVIRILQRFQLSLASEEPLTPMLSITLKCTGNNWQVKLKHRD